jgi:rhamnosyltransferase
MKNIAAGIVLYNPDIIRLKENINAIQPQVEFIVLVDNDSTNIKKVEYEYSNSNKVFIIKNSNNMGIATALNQIVQFCEHKNHEWVLTLDQDSVVPYNLIKSYERYTNLDRIGIITPKIIDRNYLEDDNVLVNILEPEYEYVEKCITSASFINIPICRKIGYFDVKMFIDLVDFEYCIRLQKAKYKILRLNHISLIHQLGDLKVYNVLGKKIFVTNHSEIRNYYYARNSVYYLKKHKDYLSKKDVYLKLLTKMIKVSVFEKRKILKLKAIFFGMKDGVKM